MTGVQTCALPIYAGLGEVRGLLAKAGVPESAVESRYYSELLIAAGLVAKP